MEPVDGKLTFRATILKGEKSACRLVRVPFIVEQHFHKRSVVECSVTFSANGKTAKSPGPLYPSGKAVPGEPRKHILLLRTDVREKLGVAPGDEVEVSVPLPTTKRVSTSTSARAIKAKPVESSVATDDKPKRAVKRRRDAEQ